MERNQEQNTHHEVATNVYEPPSTKEVVRFLHAALGFTTKQTLLAAIRNNQLTSFPGLTTEAVSRHFPESDETQKGHMRQTRQGVRSTKVIDEDAVLNFRPTPGVKHNDVYLWVYDATKKSMYSDQTGRFPVVSSRGNKYVMVACELDSNYIDAQPMHDLTTLQLIQSYQNIYTCWKATQVIAPNWYILNYEAPDEFKNAIRSNGCHVDLRPADMHRRNAAERAIQTLKGHYISVSGSCRRLSNNGMGPTGPTVSTHPQSASTREYAPQRQCIHIPPWAIRLWTYAPGTHGMHSAIPYQANAAQELGGTLQRQMVPANL